MFRCTECNSEYEIKPDFCDCGNDEFIEVAETPAPQAPEEITYQEAAPSSIFEQNSLQPQVEYKEEVEEEQFNFDPSFVKKKKVTYSLTAASIIISIILFLLVGNDTTVKVDNSAEKEAALQAKKEMLAKTIPDVDSFWDNTPAFKSGGGSGSSTPLLNKNFKNLGSDLKQYIYSVGKTFASKWDIRGVSGSGICKIEYIINRDGSFAKSNIVYKSENQSLNDSVNMAISEVSKVDAPPKDYHGERVQLAFEITKDRKPKIYYP